MTKRDGVTPPFTERPGLPSSPTAIRTAASPLAVAPRLPERLNSALEPHYRLALGEDGHAYIVTVDLPNPRGHQVGTREANAIIADRLRKAGSSATSVEVRDIAESMRAHAELYLMREPIRYRNAEIPGGLEVALYDDRDTRVVIKAGRVQIVTAGSPTVFYRTPTCRPMAIPADQGDVQLLKRYVNLDDVQFLLFIALVTYTMAHPKIAGSKFIILVLLGGQGSGKSHVANIALRLIDPSTLGVQRFPGSARDFAIAAQGAHVLAYDNLRAFSPSMSDLLCTASSGGTYATRALYTNSEQTVLPLHVALILNGIYGAFISQPDLAQRCLVMHLRPIDESQRRSEADLARQFEADLPVIQRGLFDLIAEILKHVDTVEVTSPERMIDFSRWLAAMEQAHGVPADVYQSAYSAALNDGQLDTLLDNLLGATVLEFAEKLDEPWTGTPTELLGKLSNHITLSAERSRAWPSNPIALSRRLTPLAAALHTQGVVVELSRGRHRTITIRKKGGTK
jgi:hypothetical protein